MANSDPASGVGWWTIREAAIAVGKSPKTIRRRIQSGELEGQRDESDPSAPWMLRRVDVLRVFSMDGPTVEPVRGGSPVRVTDHDEMADAWRHATRRAEHLADELRAVSARLAAAEALLSRRKRKRLDDVAPPKTLDAGTDEGTTPT